MKFKQYLHSILAINVILRCHIIFLASKPQLVSCKPDYNDFLWICIFFSFLGHKEFRFIFPVVPLAMCYCGLFLSSQSGPYSNKKEKTSEGSLMAVLRSGWKAKVMVFLLAMTNIPLALYTCTVHQKGTVDVMEYIQVESFKLRSNDDMSVLFLMPCHSTPFYRYRTIHSKHNILGGFIKFNSV